MLSVFPVFSAPLPARDCLFARTLPGYSHNDYDNDRPLHDALALGYRGVEVDVFVREGKLLVAHSRKETDASRTLEGLYLAPLRELIQRCGGVYPDTTPFLLNIELKDEGPGPYRALRQVLLDYQDILSTDSDRERVSGPVRVVLVGWHPTLEDMAADPVRVARVQGWISHRGVTLPAGPDALVGLFSLNYGRTLRWRGRGVMPTADRKVFSHVSRARHRYPGVPIRAYNVPTDPKVYQVLFAAGVDLIGTENIERTRDIMRDLGGALE